MRMGLAAFVALLAVASAEAGWQDRLPVGKDALVVKSAAGDVRVDPLAANLFRVRVAKDGAWMESGMNRYGILKSDWAAVKCEKSATSVKTAAGGLHHQGILAQRKPILPSRLHLKYACRGHSRRKRRHAQSAENCALSKSRNFHYNILSL